jgi:Cu-Zn family superoxide dismutase
LEGLTAGKRGFHIHETGTCDAPTFESAGDHFNPTGALHGSVTSKAHHAGDMNNLEVARDGSAHIDVMNKDVTAEGSGENSLFKTGGTALIVHAKPDDYKSQPSGEAGDRIACGVIERQR